MREYDVDHDDIVQGLIDTLEKDTQQKVFTIKVIDREPEEQILYAFIVFEDKSVLQAQVKVENVRSKLALRIQGNFI